MLTFILFVTVFSWLNVFLCSGNWLRFARGWNMILTFLELLQ